MAAIQPAARKLKGFFADSSHSVGGYVEGLLTKSGEAKTANSGLNAGEVNAVIAQHLCVLKGRRRS
jgi:hypothetical protein